MAQRGSTGGLPRMPMCDVLQTLCATYQRWGCRHHLIVLDFTKNPTTIVTCQRTRSTAFANKNSRGRLSFGANPPRLPYMFYDRCRTTGSTRSSSTKTCKIHRTSAFLISRAAMIGAWLSRRKDAVMRWPSSPSTMTSGLGLTGQLVELYHTRQYNTYNIIYYECIVS